MKKLLIVMTLATFAITSCDSNKTVELGYSGNDISDKVSIRRDKNTRKVSFATEIEGKWALYAGSSVEEIDLSKPILTGNEKGTFEIAVNDTARSYFQLVTKEGNAILAEKHLPMNKGYNFRDMGGLKNTEGKYVKWGKVFRSDDLFNLTDSDLGYLSSIPLVSIVDFRSSAEIEAAPDRNPTSLKKNYALSISPGNLTNTDQVMNLSSDEMDSLMVNLNRQLVTDSLIINQYKTYFDLLQSKDDVPLMFHCSAGKDRTGMGAALFLFSVGVDEDTILKDYLMSNKYLGDKYAPLIAQHPAVESLFVVRPHFLKAGIDQIKKDHGSVDSYLTNVLKVDLQKMKELYLY